MDHHGPAIVNLIMASVLAFVVPLLQTGSREFAFPSPQVRFWRGLSSLMFLSGMKIDPGSLWGAPQCPRRMAGQPG